uniref:Uncharacterized protein n=1 Tax=Myotis myotis TaxID=51298 RepID=A0A7J7V3K3_MYOMY|nr:hypothetical protein mMyoMyo1_008484 [Myotis myotis]
MPEGLPLAQRERPAGAETPDCPPCWLWGVHFGPDFRAVRSPQDSLLSLLSELLAHLDEKGQGLLPLDGAGESPPQIIGTQAVEPGECSLGLMLCSRKLIVQQAGGKVNENEPFGKSVPEADRERLRGAGEERSPEEEGGACAGGSWLNQLLAEVAADPGFSLDRPRRSRRERRAWL